MNYRTCVGLFLMSLGCAVLEGVSAQSQPSATSLGTLGGTWSAAYAISDVGQVVGGSFTLGDTAVHAFSWTSAGGMVDLGTLGGISSEARAVNSAGQVVGAARMADDTPRAFLWTASGGIVDLGHLGGVSSEARAINADGQVVGNSYAAGDANVRAFSWTAEGGMADLGTLGGSWSSAYAVNDAGQVVGSSQLEDGTVHAFLWAAAGGMSDLGTLGGSYSDAVAINAAGQVVGYGSIANDASEHAFSWTAAGGMIDLGTLGGSYSNAVAVNDAGQVVGSSSHVGESDSWAFSWTAEGGMIDLGVLGEAVAVNDAGQVVGREGFVWTAASGIVQLDGNLYALNNLGQVVGYTTATSDSNFPAALWQIGNTSEGATVSLEPTDETTGATPLNITFFTVTQSGETTLNTSAGGPVIPSGFALGDPAVFYNVTTTAVFSGPIRICVDATAAIFPDGSELRLLHFEDGTWQDVTTPGQVDNFICGTVTSLSPFAVVRLRPMICPLFDQTKTYKAGSTVPITLQLCSVSGANMSRPSIAVVATGVHVVSTSAPGPLAASGNANPGYQFRFAGDRYVFNLSLKAFQQGTYSLTLTAGNDPTTHRVQFQVK